MHVTSTIRGAPEYSEVIEEEDEHSEDDDESDEVKEAEDLDDSVDLMEPVSEFKDTTLSSPLSSLLKSPNLMTLSGLSRPANALSCPLNAFPSPWLLDQLLPVTIPCGASVNLRTGMAAGTRCRFTTPDDRNCSAT